MILETARTLLGWLAVFNLALVTIWFLAFTCAHDALYRLHRHWFQLSPETFDTVHYAGMAGYKIAVWFFCLIPYLVLRLFF